MTMSRTVLGTLGVLGLLLSAGVASAQVSASGSISIGGSGSADDRTNEQEVTIFKSLGLACEDVATAEFVWRLNSV